MDTIAPYGGKLVDLLASGAERDELLARVPALPSLQLSTRAAHDLELLATGGFSPLTTFLGRADYERVLLESRLADGTLWPIPITLTAPRDALPALGREVVLRDAHSDPLAVMTLAEVFPRVPEIGLTTEQLSPIENAGRVLALLLERGSLPK